MNLLTLACLALQGLCMYARIVQEREAATDETPAAASPEAPPTESELPTRLAVETDQGVTLSPLTLTGGSELMKSSAQDVAAGRRRPRRSKPLTATTLVEMDGLSLAQPVAGSLTAEHGAACDPNAMSAARPMLHVPAEPAPVVLARPPAVVHTTRRPTGDTWRRALARVAITCPCAACGGLLLMLKGLGRRTRAALGPANSWALAPAG